MKWSKPFTKKAGEPVSSVGGPSYPLNIMGPVSRKLWNKAKADPDTIAARLSDGGILYLPQEHECCDDRWKLKLRIARQRILDERVPDPHYTSYAEGYSDGMDKAVTILEDMLGPESEGEDE